jgi:hypothetical protein
MYALRREAWQTLEDRQLRDYAIAKGEGGVYLRLSPTPNDTSCVTEIL